MIGFEAQLLQEPMDWAGGRIRLLVVEHLGGGAAHWLMADGNWRTVTAAESGAISDEPVGILLPRESIEAIAVAIQQWQGHTSHADTEARVLREWLAVETRRVDEALEDRAAR